MSKGIGGEHMATIGINISGGEFGGTGGTHNSTYHYPTLSELKFYADKGVDFVRLPIRWERVQDALDGPLDLSGDIALIKQVLVNAASLGMDVIIDVHNYGRYNGVAIGAPGGPTAAQFADFWKKMAIEFKDMPALAGYDLMNEPHDMPTATIWKEAAQAATNAIREVDMDNTVIIEGTAWAGAHSWLKYNADLIINDPANKIVYQAHQYFDADSSGDYGKTYEMEGADPMVGVRRLEPFVQWLEANNLKGMIGETGVPSDDPRWLEVQKNALDYMIEHNLDVTAWASGTWWPETYSMYMGKPNAEDSAFGDLLEQYYNKFDGFETSGPSPSHTSPIAKIGDATLDESAGTMTFTVIRSGDLSGSSVVNFSTRNGTATAGSDYTATTGSATFAPGETTKTITVAITADTLAEANETLKVNLTAGSNVRIFDGHGVGTIREGVSTSPAVSIDDVAVNEEAGTMTFTVTRSGTLTDASSVNFATSSGTATAADYTGLTGSVNFAAGETTKTITVAITNDTVVELGETLNVNLTGGSNVSITKNVGVGTINTSDVGPGVIVGTNATETLNGTSGVDAIYAFDGHDTIMGSAGADFVDGGLGGNQINYVESSAGVNVDLTRAVQQGGHAEGDQLVSISHVAGSNYADVVTGNGSGNDLNGNGGRDVLTGGAGADRFIFESAAEADGDVITDYTAQDRLSFTAGVPTTTTYWLTNDGVNSTLRGDMNGDGVADFTITVNGVQTALNGVTLSTAPPPQPPEIVITDEVVNEVDGTITFTVTRSGDLTRASSMNYATAGGTATAGSDYTTATGTVDFAVGETTKTIVVAITNDTAVEASETFNINLSGGTNVTFSDGQGVGTINSEDVAPPPPPPSVAVNDVTVNEADGVMTFTVTRSGDLTGSSTVNYATANGTASAGSDYTAATGTVSFAAGQATATVQVLVVNDTLVEGAETLTLNLSGGTNVTIGDGQAVATINSEDVAPPPPPPSVAVNDVSVNEGAGTLVFTVTRSGDLTGSSTVNYATANSTATAGSDYTAAMGTVTFAVGQATATVAVQITDDTLVESSETLTLDLSGGTNVTIGDSQGVGTINSEDVAPVLASPGTIMGTAAGETISGTLANDLIDALGGNDVVNGRGGADRLTGGAGSDRFVFDSQANAAGDMVTDFSIGSDVLDFRAIDANPFRKGDQKFTWLDTGVFTGTAGQLREYIQDGKHFVAGDLNGDRIADFTIEVAGTTNLTSADILF
jgi:Ca2+-binding RTX toxin-like protein